MYGRRERKCLNNWEGQELGGEEEDDAVDLMSFPDCGRWTFAGIIGAVRGITEF